MSRRDAEWMDPKEGLFLETVAHLLEAQGLTRQAIRESYGRNVGVYVGASSHDAPRIESNAERESISSVLSTSIIANKVSHFFGFEGPSVALDTMCSSATVAVHTACKDVSQGECSLAIAGGVNLNLRPEKYIGLTMTGMLASRADSRSFTNGDGYIPTEAVAAVLLKPLLHAIADGDEILAVVRSSASNHTGDAFRYAAPNPDAQSRLIQKCLTKCGIGAPSISYVEAAASGAALGDVAEISALKQAFRNRSSSAGVCSVGTVKYGMGHAEAASGMMQLAKVVLQMRHKQLVPSITRENVDPSIDFADSPFSFQRDLAVWNRPRVTVDGEEIEYPRRALINSFGAGGSNACLLIEEYDGGNVAADAAARPSAGPHVVVLSAQDADRLRAVARLLLAYVQEERDLSLRRLAYTLQTGRESMSCRLALVVGTRDELLRALNGWLEKPAKRAATYSDVAIYEGDLDENIYDVKHLTAGKSGDAVMRILVAEGDPDKLALLWAKGARIPWDALYEDRPKRLTTLPLYPFRRRPRGERADAARSTLGTAPISAPPAEDSRFPSGSPVLAHIAEYLSTALKLSREEVKPHKTFRSYGVDSIVVARLMQSIEERFGVKVFAKDVLEHPSVAAIAELVEKRRNAIPETANAAASDQRSAGAANRLPDRPPDRAAQKQSSDDDSRSRSAEILHRFKRGEVDLADAARIMSGDLRR